MLLSVEVLVSQTKMDIVHPGRLKELPSFGVVAQAISMLCKKRETVCSDSYVYVKFPFGVINYDGLKDLQKYHQYLKDRATDKQNQAWLSECESISDVNLKSIKDYFKRPKLDHEASLTNLTGKHWVTENEMGLLFKILNRSYTDVMCLVCTPDKHIDETVKIKCETFIGGKVLVALNVGQDITSNATLIADGGNKGNHWGLLALDTETKHAYYGDSLGWAIPRNLQPMVEPLLQRVGIELQNYTVSSINSENDSNPLFYPTQTCSDMCGVIVLCMAAVMCCAWDTWLKWNSKTAPTYLSRPSNYSKHLRLNLISWIVQDKIDLNGITKGQSSEKNPNGQLEPKENPTEDDHKSEDTDHYSENEVQKCAMKTHISQATMNISSVKLIAVKVMLTISPVPLKSN